MIIRKEQLDRFADLTRKQYIDRLVEFLNQRFPESAKVPRAELRAEVSRQVERAAACGLATEQQAAAYILTAWLMGRDFAVRYPAAAAILGARLPADAKADKLAAWAAAVFEALET